MFETHDNPTFDAAFARAHAARGEAFRRLIGAFRLGRR